MLLLTKADLRAWYAKSFFYTFPKKSFFILLRIWLCFATAQVVTSWIDVVHHHRFLPSDIFKLERSGWKNPNKCIHLSAIIGRQAARIFIAKNHLRSLPSSPTPFHLSKVEWVRAEGPRERKNLALLYNSDPCYFGHQKSHKQCWKFKSTQIEFEWGVRNLTIVFVLRSTPSKLLNTH